MTTISDVTLRDGWHMFNYNMSIEFIDEYSKFAEKACIDVLEVGHGLSIGCKEPSINLSDSEIIETARKNLVNTKLSTLVNPDFCSIEYADAITKNVDIIRLSCIPTEIFKIENFAKHFLNKKEVWVSLLFTSKFSNEQIVQACSDLWKMGLKTVVIFDTAGNYTPEIIKQRISSIKKELPDMTLGFHGHNNLQLAISNSLTAKDAGATIVDVSLHGIGGGSGNAQLEIFTSLCKTNTNLIEIYKMSDSIEYFPKRTTENIRNAMKNYSPFFKKLGAEPEPYI